MHSSCSSARQGYKGNVLSLALILSFAAIGSSSNRQVRVDLPAPTFRIPSERLSGNPVVDRIVVTYYRAKVAHAPAVVFVHSLGEGRKGVVHQSFHRMAQRFAAGGITAAVMELPYHMRRLPRGVSALRLYTGSSDDTLDAYDQAASDVSTVATWLRGQPGVDSARIGVVGLSLGAIIAHLAMGRDDSMTAGVAILGGGDLMRLRRESMLTQIFHPRSAAPTEEQALRISEIDPVSFADRNRPRRVLMIQAARDLVVPPANAESLWGALGRPPIRWVDSNHFAPVFSSGAIGRAAIGYLQSVWSGAAPGEERIPSVYVPTVKLGLVSGLDSPATLALQWQAINLFQRPDHMALMHLDLGAGGRGLFAGLALTVNPSLDVGIGRRLNGSGFRPYMSLHLVF